MTFNKGTKTCQWGKNSLFNNDDGSKGYPHAKKIILNLDLTKHTKINSKALAR